MARHLLVAHAVDDNRRLVAAAHALALEDPDAEFVAVVPTTASTVELLLDAQASPRRIAAQRAQRLGQELVAAEVKVIAVRLGNNDPERAVDDALRFASYASIVVASPKHRLMHAVHHDLACRLACRYPDVRVVHANAVGGVSRPRRRPSGDARTTGRRRSCEGSPSAGRSGPSGSKPR
jgi:hypothetical protein